MDNIQKLQNSCTVIWKVQSALVNETSRNAIAHLLEIVARPLSSTMSLSIPRGPSVVAIVCATAKQAEMLERSCGVPWEVSVPSIEEERRLSAAVHKIIIGEQAKTRGDAEKAGHTAQEDDRGLLREISMTRKWNIPMDSPFEEVFPALCRRILFCFGIEMELWN